MKSSTCFWSANYSNSWQLMLCRTTNWLASLFSTRVRKKSFSRQRIYQEIYNTITLRLCILVFFSMASPYNRWPTVTYSHAIQALSVFAWQPHPWWPPWRREARLSSWRQDSCMRENHSPGEKKLLSLSIIQQTKSYQCSLLGSITMELLLRHAGYAH